MTGTQDSDDRPDEELIPDDRELDLDAYEDIEDWSGIIAFAVVELMRAWSRERPFVIHVKTTQGTGKSLGEMETIPLHIGPAAVFGPRHKDIKADANEDALRSLYEVHFEGKNQVCHHPVYEGRHHTVHPDVSADWCEECDYRSDCSYWDAYRMVNEREFYQEPNHSDPDYDHFQKNQAEYREEKLNGYTAVHQHLPLHPTILSQWSDIAAVLIDESPWDATAEKSVTIPFEEIKRTKAATKRLIEAENRARDYTALYDALDSLERLVDPDDDYGDHRSTFEQWMSVYEHYEKKKQIDAVSRAVSTTRDKTEDNIGMYVIGPLFTAIPNIQRGWDRALDANESFVTQRPPRAFWRTEGPSLHLRWMETEQLAKIARNTPVAVLATEMPTAQVEAMFDLPVVTVTDNLMPAVDVLQLGTRAAGITQLAKKQKLWTDLLELTKLAIERERFCDSKVFIAVKKRLVEDVQTHLEEQGFEKGRDFEIGNYYGLTGSNRFEDCDAVVLFGKPQLREEDSAYKALASGVSKEEFHKESSEGELRDALHRIRPAKKGGVRAYIWTNIVDFENEFTGDYQRDGVPDLKRRLTNDIDNETERQDIQTAIIEFVRDCDGDATATEITNNISGTHGKIQRYRDELEEEGKLEIITESDGPGRPAKKYRVSETLTN